MTLKRVVVTGLGALTPVGNTLSEYWESLKAGKSGAAPITRFDASTFAAKIAGEVRNFDIGQYLAPKEARRMDFFIHILDDRAQLPTMVLNNFAHQKTVLKTYEAVAEYVPAGNNSFVVIMTEGYRTDALALESLLGRGRRALKASLADLAGSGR